MQVGSTLRKGLWADFLSADNGGITISTRHACDGKVPVEKCPILEQLYQQPKRRAK